MIFWPVRDFEGGDDTVKVSGYGNMILLVAEVRECERIEVAGLGEKGCFDDVIGQSSLNFVARNNVTFRDFLSNKLLYKLLM